MPTITATLDAISNACLAPCAPMLTWSSMPLLVGIVSTDAGCARILFSAVRAAETYCGIIIPLCMPDSLRMPLGVRTEDVVRNAGSLLFTSGLINAAVRLSERLPNSVRTVLSKSAAMATGSPWKLPPEIAFPLSRSFSKVTSIKGLSFAELHSIPIVFFTYSIVK